MEEKPIEPVTLCDDYELRVWVAAFEHARQSPDLYHTNEERADIAVKQLRKRREMLVDKPADN